MLAVNLEKRLTIESGLLFFIPYDLNHVYVCAFELQWVSVVKRSKTCRPSDEQTLICQFWDVTEEEKSTSWIHAYDMSNTMWITTCGMNTNSNIQLTLLHN